MELEQITRGLRDAGLVVEPTTDSPAITGVTDDSRAVSKGNLFCAVQGTRLDGHDYLEDAVRRGAAAALVARRCEIALPQVVVSDSRAAATRAAQEWYGHPAQHLKMIGVTGTNGKSTTVALVRHVLNATSSVGSIGTVGVIDGAGNRLGGYHALTTPGAVELQSILAELLERQVSTVAMEISSHGLDQGRVAAISFHAAAYTNLTHEHLDYHTDMDAYGAAKMKLSGHVREGGVEVLNADDPAWVRLPVRADVRRVTYGHRSSATVTAEKIRYDSAGSESIFHFGGDAYPVKLPLLGDYNVSNALAAAATAWGLGVEPRAIVERLSSSPQVPGRMELLESGRFTVLRDYAHTPDGFERALAAIRRITPGRVFLLFGAGGDRDPTKRAVMGRIASRDADIVIITSDNPRTEDPESILDQIESGMCRPADVRLVDREDAIRKAISMLRDGDCLLLAGKGPETYQIVGDTKFAFDEPSLVRASVRERGC
ncbi:MAG: UDP-N-acetylmuramoyl-L-alanyl-D-glutamate--2,6-diaminopimelate ligase [Gemmatimonadales bacterium]